MAHPEGIALDPIGRKFYWADDGNANIRRANLDGSSVEVLVGSGLDDPIDLALDLNIGKIFWVDAGTNRLQRANLDGSNVQQIIGSGLNLPTGIAVDTQFQKIYFSNQNAGNIWKTNYDGSGTQTLIQDTRLIFDVDLDLLAGKIYWAAENPTTLVGSIRRANLDGTQVEDFLVFNGTNAGLGLPIGLAVDSINSQLYWTDPRNGRIRRANLDRTGIVDIVTGLDNPQFVAVVIIPEPQTINLVAITLAIAVSRRTARRPTLPRRRVPSDAYN